MKRLMALAIIFTIIALVIESGRKDLVVLNHAQIVVIALGVTLMVLLLVYIPLKVWERRQNARD